MSVTEHTNTGLMSRGHVKQKFAEKYAIFTYPNHLLKGFITISPTHFCNFKCAISKQHHYALLL